MFGGIEPPRPPVEALIGRFRRELPEEASRVRVHTKFVPDLDQLPTVDRAYVERIVDRSLTRLGVERLDLVQRQEEEPAVGPRRVRDGGDVSGWREGVRASRHPEKTGPVRQSRRRTDCTRASSVKGRRGVGEAAWPPPDGPGDEF